MAWCQHLCYITSLMLQISLFRHQSPWISNMGVLHVLVTFMNWKVLFLLLLFYLNKKLHYRFLYIWSWILGCYLSDIKSYTIKHYIFGYIIYQINNLTSWPKLSLMEMRVLFWGFHSHWTEDGFFSIWGWTFIHGSKHRWFGLLEHLELWNQRRAFCVKRVLPSHKKINKEEHSIHCWASVLSSSWEASLGQWYAPQPVSVMRKEWGLWGLWVEVSLSFQCI